MNLIILDTLEEVKHYFLNYYSKKHTLVTIHPFIYEYLKNKKKKNKIELFDYNLIYYNLIKEDKKIIAKIINDFKILEKKIYKNLDIHSKISAIDLNAYYLNYYINDFFTKLKIYKNLILKFKKKNNLLKVYFYSSKNLNLSFLEALKEELFLYEDIIFKIINPEFKKIIKKSFKTFIKNKFKKIFLNYLININNLKNIICNKNNKKILFLTHVEKHRYFYQSNIIYYNLFLPEYIEDKSLFSEGNFKSKIKTKIDLGFQAKKYTFNKIFYKWYKNLKQNRTNKYYNFFKNDILYNIFFISKLVIYYTPIIKKKLKEIKPDFIFTYANTNWVESLIINIAKELKIKSVYFQHGAGLGIQNVPKNNYIYNAFDYILSYGKKNFFLKKKIVPINQYDFEKNYKFLNSNKFKNTILFISEGNTHICSIKRKITDIKLYFYQKKILEYLNGLKNYKVFYRPWIHEPGIGIENFIKHNCSNIKITNNENIYRQISQHDLIITDSVSTINVFKSLVLKKKIIFIYDENVSVYSKFFLRDLKKICIVLKNSNEINNYFLNFKKNYLKFDEKMKFRYEFIKNYVLGGDINFNRYYLFNIIAKLKKKN